MKRRPLQKNGRITHGCKGIWKDEHVDGLKEITKAFNEHDCVSGIQIADSGRKGSCLRPWDGATSIKKIMDQNIYGKPKPLVL